MHIGFNLAFASPIERLKLLETTSARIIYLSITYNTNKPRSKVWGLDSTAASFMYSVACHPLHLAASIFEFQDVRSSSLIAVGEDVFLNASLHRRDGTPCVVRGHNRATGLEFVIEAHFEDGRRVTLTNLRNWRTSTLKADKDEASGRRAESQSASSAFNLSEDVTGFHGQFRDIASRIREGAGSNQAVDVTAARKTNDIIHNILSQAKLDDF